MLQMTDNYVKLLLLIIIIILIIIITLIIIENKHTAINPALANIILTLKLLTDQLNWYGAFRHHQRDSITCIIHYKNLPPIPYGR